MLDMAGVTDGARVLDVAAGAGGQTIAAARRVGPSGTVLATDISPAILEYAQAEASTAGLSNVTTRVMDGEDLEVEPGSFDAVISRLGLIYFPDQQRALGDMRRALRDGGRVAAIVYSTPERNPFNSIPMSIIRRRAALPPLLPGQPGPFSLGAPGVVAAAFETAGFHDVETRLVDAPLRLSVGRRVCSIRAGVVRRAAPDALRLVRVRPQRGLGRDRNGLGRRSRVRTVSSGRASWLSPQGPASSATSTAIGLDRSASTQRRAAWPGPEGILLAPTPAQERAMVGAR